MQSAAINRVRSAVVRYIMCARKALAQQSLDDDAIHEARKDLKRARSGLRLLRPLDEGAYVRENTRLRNAARRFSGVRDAKVLLARVRGLLSEDRNPERRRLLVSLRRELRNERRRDWRALRSAERLHRIDDVLATAARHVRGWRTPPVADSTAADALRRLYRKGRKAIARSEKDPNDENLHEARKQAKHLREAARILVGNEPARRVRKVISRAADVGDWLGDDHDLAVVEARLLAESAASAKGKKQLCSLLEKRRSRLQKKALKAADKLFRKRTKRVLAYAAVKASGA